MPEPKRVAVDAALLEQAGPFLHSLGLELGGYLSDEQCRMLAEIQLKMRSAANGPEVGGVHCKMCAREVCGKRCPGIVAPSREAVEALCEAFSSVIRARDIEIDEAFTYEQILARVKKEIGNG